MGKEVCYSEPLKQLSRIELLAKNLESLHLGVRQIYEMF